MPLNERHAVRVLKALDGPEPLSYLEVSAQAHLIPNVAHIYLEGLRQMQPKRAYIARYDPPPGGRGRHTPRYLAGDLPDAERPIPLTREERRAREAKKEALRATQLFGAVRIGDKRA